MPWFRIGAYEDLSLLALGLDRRRSSYSCHHNFSAHAANRRAGRRFVAKKRARIERIRHLTQIEMAGVEFVVRRYGL